MTKAEFRIKVFSLSEHLYPMVTRMLGNTTKAEDAIQEIMLKLWIKRKTIENHPNIKGLVLFTARNYCIDLMRKKRVEIDYSNFYPERSENSQEQLKSMSPEKIESINVLKDQKNLEKYNSPNGVILITTKKK